MANLNTVHLIGNMTRDPDTRYTPKGTAVGDIGIAVNRRVKVGDNWQDETTFVDVTLWGQSAEFAQQYLTKGSPVFVEGRLQMDQWEDKQSGQKRSKLKVVAESIQSLAKVERQEGRNADGGRDRTAAEARQGNRDNGGGSPDDLDEIPFDSFNPPLGF
jgi:single-strand DNA-binding protein